MLCNCTAVVLDRAHSWLGKLLTKSFGCSTPTLPINTPYKPQIKLFDPLTFIFVAGYIMYFEWKRHVTQTKELKRLWENMSEETGQLSEGRYKTYILQGGSTDAQTSCTITAQS